MVDHIRRIRRYEEPSDEEKKSHWATWKVWYEGIEHVCFMNERDFKLAWEVNAALSIGIDADVIAALIQAAYDCGYDACEENTYE
jgi:hypothetical protein